MTDIELRTTRRKVKREGDRFVPVLLLVGVTFISCFLLLRHLGQKQAAEEAAALARAQAEQQTEKTAEEQDAEIRRRLRASIDGSNSTYRAAPTGSNSLTTDSGRVYYAPPKRQDEPSYEPTPAERYARAVEIMQQSRQVQKQIDRQMYGGSGVANDRPIVVTVNDRACAFLRNRKEALDERMRRGYWNIEAEQLHEDWRQINREMVQNGCR